MPGMKWSTVLEVASIGTRLTGPHGVSLVDLLITMSLDVQPGRTRHSAQATPPWIGRNERFWDWLALFIGTSTVPLGRTSGWPPRPVALSPLLRAGPQLSPPLLEGCILMRLPSAVLSHSV